MRHLHIQSFSCTTATMPLKTPTTPAKLTTPRLSTVSHLRIRRPNRVTDNPCVGILSSVLSNSRRPPFPHAKMESRAELIDASNRLLGILKLQSRILRQTRTSFEGLYGSTGTSFLLFSRPFYTRRPRSSGLRCLSDSGEENSVTRRWTKWLISMRMGE